MMSLSFSARPSSASICRMLRSAARTRASLSITLVVTSSDLRLCCSTSPRAAKAVMASEKRAVGTRSVRVDSTARPRRSLLVCSSATTPSHDETSRITSDAGPADGPRVDGDLAGRDHGPRHRGGGSAPGRAAGERPCPAPARAALAPESTVVEADASAGGLSRQARARVEAPGEEDGQGRDQDEHGHGHEDPQLLLHVAVTRATPDRFRAALCHAFGVTDQPGNLRVAVVGAGISGLAAAHRLRAASFPERRSSCWRARRGSAAACAPRRWAASSWTSAPRRCSTGGPRPSAWPGRSGSATTSCTPPPSRPDSGTAGTWCRCRAR